MELLKAKVVSKLADLDVHYLGAGVPRNLMTILDQVEEASLLKQKKINVHSLAENSDIGELINALRALGFTANAVLIKGLPHAIEVSW